MQQLVMFRAILVPTLPPVLLCGLAGCTTIELSDIEGERHHYFGWVHIEVPRASEAITATRAETLGLTLADGMTLGWNAHDRIAVPLRNTNPDATDPPCSMVVIVRSHEEAEYLRNVINQLQGVELCLVPFAK